MKKLIAAIALVMGMAGAAWAMVDMPSPADQVGSDPQPWCPPMCG